MKIAVYSAHDYDRDGLNAANANAGHDLLFIKAPLSADTARQAAGCGGTCIFVNDHADAAALRILAEDGVHLLALRCAGFNNVDAAEAKRLGISVTRVGDYSPHSVAEHAVVLLLALNRNIPIAHERVLANDFHLDGLMGFDLYGKPSVSSVPAALVRCLRASCAVSAAASSRTMLIRIPNSNEPARVLFHSPNWPRNPMPSPCIAR